MKISLETTNKLRNEKINTELYSNPESKLDKQLKYADRKNIPFVIIIGPEESKSQKYKLKDMKAGKEEELKLEEIVKRLK